MKKPTEFIAEIRINYSDDAGQGLEKRFVFKPKDTYDDFMSECDKFYAFVRATFGSEAFDALATEEVTDEGLKVVKNDSDKK